MLLMAIRPGLHQISGAIQALTRCPLFRCSFMISTSAIRCSAMTNSHLPPQASHHLPKLSGASFSKIWKDQRTEFCSQVFPFQPPYGSLVLVWWLWSGWDQGEFCPTRTCERNIGRPAFRWFSQCLSKRASSVCCTSLLAYRYEMIHMLPTGLFRPVASRLTATFADQPSSLDTSQSRSHITAGVSSPLQLRYQQNVIPCFSGMRMRSQSRQTSGLLTYT